jgi:hypothetical protein
MSTTFRNIAKKESATEAKYTMGIVDAIEKEQDVNDQFLKKVGDRGGEAPLDVQIVQVMTLAQSVQQKYNPNTNWGGSYYSQFLSPIHPVNSDTVNERACKLLAFIGTHCESAMKLPEFDAVRSWVKLDYATSRAMYG